MYYQNKDLGRNYLEKETERLPGKGNFTCQGLEVKKQNT